MNYIFTQTGYIVHRNSTAFVKKEKKPLFKIATDGIKVDFAFLKVLLQLNATANGNSVQQRMFCD